MGKLKKYPIVAFFFLFFLHGTSIGNGQQGISYNSLIGDGFNLANHLLYFIFYPIQNKH
jgi:hypothetical protein